MSASKQSLLIINTEHTEEEVVEGLQPEEELQNVYSQEAKVEKRFYHDYTDDGLTVMLNGIAAVHPSLHVDSISRSIFLNRYRKHRVGLLTGGGSGHEPFAAGYVGENMLTCAVAGSIFSSPPSQAILTAIKNVAELNLGGVLVLFLNYTGDVLNFGLAVEEARFRGIEVESVVIGDDVSLKDKDRISIAGRRGISGALFAFKIAGGMSSAGRVLSEIALTVHAINARVATMGVCLTPCSLPGQGPLFTVLDDDMHLGVGIHGEAGSTIMRVCTTPEIVNLLLTRIIKNLVLENEAELCVIVNNLGTCTVMEMYIIAAEVHSQLSDKGYRILRMYTGTLLTSLDMNGIQVSILNVTGREEWLPFLDLETEAFAWPGTRLSYVNPNYKPYPVNFELEERIEEAPSNTMELGVTGMAVMRECLEAVCKAILAEEEKLNQLDSGCGDGDTGSTLKRFCKCVLGQVALMPMKKVGQIFLIMSRMAEQEMGGTSGGLYALMLLGAGRNSQDWVSLWAGSLDMMRKYSSARLGYRTMLDALIPACHIFVHTIKGSGMNAWRTALKLAVEKAAKGCDGTREMIPKAGRASYVDPNLIVDVDSGAYAVVTWLSAIYKVLNNHPLLQGH